MQAVVRERNQITLPREAVDLLELREGDVLVITVQNGMALLRPVRRSYAGIAKGIYGENFIEQERASWE